MDVRELPTGAPERSDESIRRDLLRLVECFSGEPGSWAADVLDGSVTMRRVHGRPATSAERERLTVRALAHAVPGVVSIRVLDGRPEGATEGGACGVPAVVVPLSARVPA